MAFTREELAAYEKQPAKVVSDKTNPFSGATPAQAATPAAVAAVAAGAVDATPGGAPKQAVAATTSDNDAPVVDEEGNLGDSTESSEGTSDASATEDSSTSAVDHGDAADPNSDLTGEEGQSPKKGSARERIVELNDLAEGYKLYGQAVSDENKSLKEQLARLTSTDKGTTQPTAAAPAASETEEPMPDMSDEDVAFDNDKYRAKMAKWVKGQTAAAARAAVREATGADTANRVRQEVDAKIATYRTDHPDFETVVTNNAVLKANQLAPDAGLAVAQSEHTAEILYRFGKDTAFAIRVARQSPAQQLLTIGRMIGEIEADKAAGKIKTGSQGGAKPAQKKSITQAPPPPRATPAAGQPTARNQLDPAMGMEEFARQHRANKQNARQANRQSRGLN